MRPARVDSESEFVEITHDEILAAICPTDQVQDFKRQTEKTVRTLGPIKPKPRQVWTYERIEQELKKLSTSALSSYEALKNIVDAHFACLYRRWTKKAKTKRQDMLIRAWGKMPDHMCEDFNLYSNAVTEHLSEYQRNVYLLPQINGEQLRQDTALPAWLFSRAQNPPHTFLRFDSFRTRLAENGTDLMIFEPEINPANPIGKLMDVNIASDATLYGILVSYESAEQYESAKAREDTLAPGVALLTLEAQAKQYEFLLKCCRLILHDLDRLVAQPTPERPLWPTLPSGTSLLPASILRRAFDGPQESNFSTLVTIIEGRRESVRAHLWAMQEDPAYFHDVVLEVRDHIPAQYYGSRDEGAEMTRSRVSAQALDSKLQEQLKCHLEWLFTSLRVWAVLRRYLIELEREIKRHGAEMEKTQKLPMEVALALMQAIRVLAFRLEPTIKMATRTFFASPKLGHRYAFCHKSEDMIYIFPDQKLDSISTKIDWLMTTLHNEKAPYLGYDNFVIELGTLCDSKQTGALEMLSTLTRYHLADLAILLKCRTELEFYSDKVAQAFSSYEDYVITWKMLSLEGLGHDCAVELDALPNVLDDNMRFTRSFDYPAHKCPTQENIEAMRRAENQLDSFWKPVLNDLMNNDLMLGEIFAIYGKRKPHRTLAWTPPAAACAEPQTTCDPQDLNPPLLSFMQHDSTGQSTNLPASRVKIKSRPLQAQAETVTWSDQESAFEPALTEEDLTTRNIVYQVDKHALKVFQALFFTPKPSAQRAQISWNDLLHAMTSLGFDPVKLYGSVWMFEPPVTLKEQGSIQFNEPAQSRLPYTMTRAIGRQLSRRYGLEGPMIVGK